MPRRVQIRPLASPAPYPGCLAAIRFGSPWDTVPSDSPPRMAFADEVVGDGEPLTWEQVGEVWVWRDPWVATVHEVDGAELIPEDAIRQLASEIGGLFRADDAVAFDRPTQSAEAAADPWWAPAISSALQLGDGMRRFGSLLETMAAEGQASIAIDGPETVRCITAHVARVSTRKGWGRYAAARLEIDGGILDVERGRVVQANFGGAQGLDAARQFIGAARGELTWTVREAAEGTSGLVSVAELLSPPGSNAER